MAAKSLPCPTVLRQLVTYNPDTGDLFWLPRQARLFPDTKRQTNACAIWNSAHAGNKITAIGSDGYVRVCIFGRLIMGHRIAFAILHGRWPSSIDHINGVRTDNRAANLREVSAGENNKNLSIRATNKSGTTGVCRGRGGKWRAFITSGKSHVHIGEFREKSAAIAARKDAEVRLGFHANHGRPKTTP